MRNTRSWMLAALVLLTAGVVHAQGGSGTNEPGAQPGKGRGQSEAAKKQRQHAGPADAARGESLRHRPILVSQGGKTQKVYPLIAEKKKGNATVTVEQFYGYSGKDIASSNTSPPLEVSKLSQMLFYLEADIGRLSLVIIHGKAASGSGGKAKLAFKGLPQGVLLAVSDDPGETAVPQGGLVGKSLEWTWWACCTDGSVLADLSGGFDLTITPELFAGIDSWKIRSGRDVPPLGLDMTKPVRLKLGGPQEG